MANLPPLTHHDILGLVEPFTRRGRRVDLDASDRIARRVAFKPIRHDGGLREDLQLEHLFARLYRLTRTLTSPAGGPSAILSAEGTEPGALLALIESIEPSHQLKSGPGYVMAHRHHIEVDSGSKVGAEAPLLLTGSVVRTCGLTLTLTMPTVKRRPADLDLVADAEVIDLPEDLLAVIGWDWAPLKRVDARLWKSKLRLRGLGPSRSRSAEAKLERTARHLAQTLCEPPPRFHERFVWARWGAVVRRMIPILTAIGVVVLALLLPADYIKERPWLRVVLMNAPLLLIGLSFTLQEMSRIELPPVPRPPPPRAWRPELSRI